MSHKPHIPDLILLYRLTHVFCDLNVSDFISFSPDIFNTKGNGLKTGTEHFSNDFRRHSISIE